MEHFSLRGWQFSLTPRNLLGVLEWKRAIRCLEWGCMNPHHNPTSHSSPWLWPASPWISRSTGKGFLQEFPNCYAAEEHLKSVLCHLQISYVLLAAGIGQTAELFWHISCAHAFANHSQSFFPSWIICCLSGIPCCMQNLLLGWLGVNLNITVRQGVDEKPWHAQKLAKPERDHGLFIQEDGAECPKQWQVFI